MKSKNKMTGIITLAVVTVLAVAIIIGTRFLVNKEDKPAVSDHTAKGTIDLTGYENTGDVTIKQASELLADDGSVDGYLVTVASKGYGGDIIMDVTLDKTGDTIKSLSIKEQSETDGLGARITEDAFLSQFNGLPAPISLSSSEAKEEGKTEETAEAAKKEPAKEETPAKTSPSKTKTQSSWANGTYVAETEEFDQNGFKDKVTLTIKDGKMTELVWDAYNEAGELKSVLSADGAYEMTENGPTWQEQAIAIANYVIENQSTDAIHVKDDGKTDSVSGVSISVGTFIKLVKDCLAQAKPSEYVDGTYTAQGSEYNGYVGLVTLVVKDGAITSVVWDGRNEAGEYKSYLSSVGKYVMVKGHPTWKEQADALAANVIANQNTAGIVVDDEGKTDSVAGVSISVGEFVDLVKQCLKKAAVGDTSNGTESKETKDVSEPEPTTAPETDNTAETPGKIDGISGATISSTAVVNGINQAQTFIKGFVLAK